MLCPGKLCFVSLVAWDSFFSLCRGEAATPCRLEDWDSGNLNGDLCEFISLEGRKGEREDSSKNWEEGKKQRGKEGTENTTEEWKR